MNETDIKLLEADFLLGENLTPYKSQATIVAYTDHPDISFVLKEIDQPRSTIYDKLTGIWNPFIANTYDTKKLDSCYVAVTEHVFGMSLTEYIAANGTMDTETAITFCLMLCDALKSIHHAGIIHKDITPNNILITEDHKLKLIDFGIARVPSAQNDTEILGTRGFVAPEVRSDLPSTYTADLYSLGCILNYMLTGKEPGELRFTGDSQIERILNHTVCIDPKDRYRNVRILENTLKNAQNIRKSKCMAIRSHIPGFRSGTPWKMFVASTGYCYIAFLNVYEYFYESVNIMYFVDLFWVLIPLFITTSEKWLKRLLPHRITGNIYSYNLFRFLGVVLSYVLGFFLALKLIGWKL